MEETKPVESFKDRLLSEKLELGTRLNKLYKFIGTDKFYTLPQIQRSLLIIQLSAMDTYLKCLNERLEYLGT